MRAQISLLLIVLSLCSFAQDKQLDSLFSELKKSSSKGLNRVYTLTEVANRLVISNPDSSLMIVKEIEQQAEYLKDEKLLLKLNNVKGQIYAIKGDFKQSEFYFQSNLTLASEQNVSNDVLTTYVNLGELYRITYRLDTGLYYLNKAKLLASEHLLGSGQHVRLRSLLLVYKCMKGDYAGGIIEGQKAIDLSNTYGHTFSLIYLNANMGRAYMEIGQYSKAISYFQAAVDYASRYNNLQNLANAYNLIASVYQKQQDYANSLKYMQKALFYSMKIAEPGALSEAYGNIATNYLSLGEIDSARVFFRRSEELADQSGHPVAKAMVASSMADMAYQQLNFSLTLKQFQKSVAIYQSIGDSLGVIRSSSGIAKAQWALNQRVQAIQSAVSAYQMAIRLNSWEEQAEILSQLTKYYKVIGNSAELSAAFEALLQVKDSLQKANDWKETNQLLADFSLKEQLKLMEAEQREKEYQLNEQLSNQKTTFYLMAGAFLILSMAFAWYFNTLRLKKRAFSELQIQKELLAAQTEELNASNEIKDRLFSVIAHDLRSPLGSLHSLIQLMSTESVTESEFRSFLPQLEAGVAKANHITQQLLNWSSIQFSGDQPQLAQVDIFKLVEEEVHLVSPQISQKQIEVINSIRPGDQLWSDEGRLSIIVRNLLGNAIKFSKPQGQIEIRFLPRQDEAVIQIQDYGVGMSLHTLQRVQSGISTTSPGTAMEAGVGLGLLIVRDMVKSLQGKIELQSEENQGTLFSVILPVKHNS